MKKPALCHSDRPHRAKGLCASCYVKSRQTPYKVIAARARANKWRQENPEKAWVLDREKHLRRHYGITLQQYEKLLAQQNGTCALCKKPETIVNRTGRKTSLLAVDHCHKSGKVRGLLCFRCNTAVGVIEKQNIANKIGEYLGDIF